MGRKADSSAEALRGLSGRKAKGVYRDERDVPADLASRGFKETAGLKRKGGRKKRDGKKNVRGKATVVRTK